MRPAVRVRYVVRRQHRQAALLFRKFRAVQGGQILPGRDGELSGDRR
jgi:hypothetical protein